MFLLFSTTNVISSEVIRNTFLFLFVLSRVRVAVAHEAHDCDFTLRETKATSETHLYLAFIDIFAHNHGSFWTDVD